MFDIHSKATQLFLARFIAGIYLFVVLFGGFFHTHQSHDYGDAGFHADKNHAFHDDDCAACHLFIVHQNLPPSDVGFQVQEESVVSTFVFYKKLTYFTEVFRCFSRRGPPLC